MYDRTATSTYQLSQRTMNVVNAFKEPINNLYISVYDTVYAELTRASVISFNAGWTEAVAYMKAHPDCTLQELFQARDQTAKECYPHARMIDLKTEKDEN